MELKSVAASLKKGFAAYKDQYQQAAELLRQVQADIRRLAAERRDLQLQQCTRDEFVGAMCAQVDRLAEEGRNRRMEQLQAWAMPKAQQRPKLHFSPHMFTWRHVKAVTEGSVDFFGSVGLPFLFASGSGGHGTNTVLVDAPALCTVLGEAIKANLKTFFEGVEWPEERSASDRLAQVAQIEAQLAEMRATEAELIALIDDNSISPISED